MLRSLKIRYILKLGAYFLTKYKVRVLHLSWDHRFVSPCTFTPEAASLYYTLKCILWVVHNAVCLVLSWQKRCRKSGIYVLFPAILSIVSNLRLCEWIWYIFINAGVFLSYKKQATGKQKVNYVEVQTI